jgi:hypothetical protein
MTVLLAGVAAVVVLAVLVLVAAELLLAVV